MNFLETLIDDQFLETFVFTLAHSLWLGFAWAVLLAVILFALPAGRSRTRYNASLVCLGGFLLSICVTWSLLQPTQESPYTMLAETTIETIPDSVPMDAHSDHSAAGPISHSLNLESSSAEITSAQAESSIDWKQLIVIGWCFGCILMLLRMVKNILSAQRLLASPDCANSEYLEVLKQLEHKLGLSHIKLKIAEAVSSPVVWGIWKPVVFLPASMATGLTVPELQAIFAHELTHIRRYDLVINFVQLVVEAFFFFNPAVWWINRCIRIEREASCDAIAAGIVSGTEHYVQVLASVALRQQSPIPSTAVAMTGTSSGSLLDRIRRLVRPDDRPTLGVSWKGLVILGLMTTVVLFGLQKGTKVAVAYAAQIMSDDDRAVQLKEQGEGIVPERFKKPDFEKFHVTGKIVYADDVKRPERLHLIEQLVDFNGNSSTIFREGVTDKIDTKVGPGRFYLLLSGDGVAPLMVGPFGPAGGPEIDLGTIQIANGISRKVKVLDEDGAPAAGVTISMSAGVKGSGAGVGQVTTDKNGMATLEHLSTSVETSLWLSGAGYQAVASRKIDVKETTPLLLSIDRSTPAVGMIVNEAGKGIADAMLYFYLRLQPGMRHVGLTWHEVQTSTDSDGAFLLDTLQNGWSYFILVRHPDFADTVISNVKPGDKDIRVVMKPSVRVSGTVKLDRNSPRPPRRITWQQRFEIPTGENGELREKWISGGAVKLAPNEADPGTATFVIEHVSIGQRIKIKDQEFLIDEKILEKPIVIDLSKPAIVKEVPMREVSIAFSHNGQLVKPQGELMINTIDFMMELPEDQKSGSSQRFVPVQNGLVTTLLPVGFKLRVKAHESGTNGTQKPSLIGFWFHGESSQQPIIEAGDGPFNFTLPVYPAGVATGKVLDTDGNPVANLSVSANYTFTLTPQQSQDGRHHSYSAGIIGVTNNDGQYFLSPLPLGAECQLAISDGFYRQAGSAFTLTSEKPNETHTFKFGKRANLFGKVLTPAGKPAPAIPIGLEFKHQQIGMSWGPPTQTKRNGNFRFEGANATTDGTYVAYIKSNKEYVPVRKVLKFGEVNNIQLKKGIRLTGRVLDQSGNPVPLARVSAMRDPFETVPNEMSIFNTEGLTDKDGRFTFSNLPDAPVKIRCDQLWEYEHFLWEPGMDNIKLTGRIAPWHQEKLDKLKSK